MYLRIFGKIQIKFGLLFNKYFKSISLKNFYFLDIINKYVKFISFVKKVIKRRLLVWCKAIHVCCQSSLQVRYVIIAIKYVML